MEISKDINKKIDGLLRDWKVYEHTENKLLASILNVVNP